jgi:signal transduction histidine kinase
VAILVGYSTVARDHRRAVDITLAAALYVGLLFATVFAPLDSRWRVDEPVTYALLAAVACGASVFRREQPVAVVGVAAGAVTVGLLFGVNCQTMALACVVPLINVFMMAKRLTALTVGGTAVAAIAVAATLASLVRHIRIESTPPGLGILMLGVACMAIGEARRSRLDFEAEYEERVRRAEHGRDEEARRRVAEERLRISRDLHDIVAHHIALITVQAGAAMHIIDQQPLKAREALETIHRAGGQALTDLYDTITLLRSPQDPETPAEPTAGLDRLDGLIDTFKQAGLRIETAVLGARRGLPAAVDIAAYRVVQESLTNVRKHAGQVGTRIELDYGAAQLTITVENAAASSPYAAAGAVGAIGTKSASGSGHGIVGMRERAVALGGGLEVGRTARGGFRVTARFPLPEPEPAAYEGTGLTPATLSPAALKSAGHSSAGHSSTGHSSAAIDSPAIDSTGVGSAAAAVR